MAKAAVFPVPVAAKPKKSVSSFMRIGSVSCWIGVGSVNPSSVMAFCISGLKLKSWNVRSAVFFKGYSFLFNRE